jgi:Kef-type K+ transport system membrane component KefB
MHFSPVAQLAAQILAILFVSRALVVPLRAMGQPKVIAEIVAGIALGPSLLGAVAPEVAAALFPAASMGVLSGLSQLGLVFFMFLVGLEFDPKLLAGRARAAAWISAWSMFVPFVLGMAIAPALHADLAPQGVPLTSFALFLGVSMSITAFPVLARILGERGMLRTTVGAMSLAGAAIGDVTAWCALAVVVAYVNSAGAGAGLATTAMAGAYIALMLLGVRPMLRRMGPRGSTNLSSDLVAATIALTLISATITEIIGIHALFGGFLVGAIVPRRGSLAAGLIEKLEDFVTIVLLPLFFALSGLRTEVGLVSSAADAWTCALIIAVASAGKFGGSSLAARWVGFDWRESAAIGVLMNTRGLMELIVLNIGLDLGVISPRLFTMMVLMALFTTWVTGPLLGFILPGRQTVPMADAGAAPVLTCLSDPSSAPALITLGAALVRPGRDPLLALHVVSPERDSSIFQSEPGPSGDGPLNVAVARAAALGTPIETMTFVSGNVAEDIVRLASTHFATLTLLGVHRPWLISGLLGGIVDKVASTLPMPLAVLVDRGLPKVERVLVLEDTTRDGAAARAFAARLARGGAQITARQGPMHPDDAENFDLVVCALEGPAGLAATAAALEGRDGCSVVGVAAGA